MDRSMEKYYRYNGSLLKSEISELLISILNKSAIDKNRITLSKEFSKILSADEFIEMKISPKEAIKNVLLNSISDLFMPIVIPGAVHIPDTFNFPLIIPIINVNINLKAITVSILALLLDIDITKGFLSGFLAVSGFNNKAFTKLDENAGEKCLLIEICSKQKHKMDISDFNNICEKECVNNNLICRYRTDEKCLMTIQEAIQKCDNLVEKNVLKKEGDVYTYLFLFQ